MKRKDERFPKGHFTGIWIGIGIAIFSGIGVPLGILTGNFGFMGIGPAIGLAFGVAVGQSMENKYEKEGKIRPLTDSEKRNQMILVTIGSFIAIAGILAFLIIYLINN